MVWFLIYVGVGYFFYFGDSLVLGGCYFGRKSVKNEGPKIVKNGPRVWAFCKIEFPGIQKPVQILTQKMGFFKKCGNRGVGVIWLVRGVCLGVFGYFVGAGVWIFFCCWGCLLWWLGWLGWCLARRFVSSGIRMSRINIYYLIILYRSQT